MSDDEALLLLAVVGVAVLLLGKKSHPSAGVTNIGPGNNTTWLPCCDVNGNIVDAGDSMYCPAGSTVDQC